MKPKHKPRINCGANKYEPIEDGFKCEFCGTEYEGENKVEYRNERGEVVRSCSYVIEHQMQNTGRRLYELMSNGRRKL